MRKKLVLASIMMAAVLSFTACASSGSTGGSGEGADREVLFQVSLLQGLTFGDYHGSITAGELKQNGDIGLGTFDGLDGEMIVLDGVVYKAKSDGLVEKVSDDETIPFSNVTFFDEDENVTLEGITDIDALKELLNEKLEGKLPNGFCVIRIDGKFKEMNVRSEYKQNEPYKPLAKVLETDQTFFDYSDIEGTVVGVLLFSRNRNMICCLAVDPEYRQQGLASILMRKEFSLDQKVKKARLYITACGL